LGEYLIELNLIGWERYSAKMNDEEEELMWGVIQQREETTNFLKWQIKLDKKSINWCVIPPEYLRNWR
jgi:hypothetical protein